MQWLDLAPMEALPLQAELALKRAALRQHPSSEELRLALAKLLLTSDAPEEALATLLEGFGGCPSHVPACTALANVYLALDQPEEALAACERAARESEGSLSAGLAIAWGRSLYRLQRRAEAEEVFFQAVSGGCHHPEVLEGLFKFAAKKGDGERLLRYCTLIGAERRHMTIVLGYRALALSLLGKADLAGEIVELNRMIVRTEVQAPVGYEDVSAFNQALAGEITASPHLKKARSETFLKTEVLGGSREPASTALLDRCRRLLEDYVKVIEGRGLQWLTDTFPVAGRLLPQANIVRGDDAHSAHLHKYAYVSGVYHVSAPPDLAEGAGALVVGGVGDLAPGHQPCWGVRLFQPEPGVATIFPAHVFHAVNATGSEASRIAVAFDRV